MSVQASVSCWRQLVVYIYNSVISYAQPPYFELESRNFGAFPLDGGLTKSLTSAGILSYPSSINSAGRGKVKRAEAQVASPRPINTTNNGPKLGRSRLPCRPLPSYALAQGSSHEFTMDKAPSRVLGPLLPGTKAWIPGGFADTEGTIIVGSVGTYVYIKVRSRPLS